MEVGPSAGGRVEFAPGRPRGARLALVHGDLASGLRARRAGEPTLRIPGAGADPRAQARALAALLWALWTGRPPWSAEHAWLVAGERLLRAGAWTWCAITGWDDTLGAWEMKNSWGESWGVGGYAMVPYGDFSLCQDAAFVQYSATPAFSVIKP
jgi:hypothetical protein